tara:strand:- start:339 stop:1052 length:714 start_codon:yes stop_codon:yes gene_type:complete
MSWTSILKKIGINEDEASKACCETARQEFIELIDMAFDSYDTDEGEWDKDGFLDDIDQMDCLELYEAIVEEKKEFEEMKGYDDAFRTKYLSDLSDIIDEFESCMGDVDKIKDEVKPIKELEPIVQKWEKIIKKEPRKGTGKKPQGSTRRLYTDENPKDTVPVKFKTAQDVRETFSSSAFKDKPHKRQSQIINLVEQRARVAAKRAKDPEAKKRLNAAHKVALSRKESSKRKTQRMKS